jgi:hypothetical protein
MKIIFSCVLALWAATLFTSSLRAQLPTPTPAPPTPPYAVITYPSANPTSQSVSVVSPSAGGTFSLVGLQPNQVVQVAVHYPTGDNFQMVNLTALDGGAVLPPAGAAVAVPSPSPLPSPLPSPCQGCIPLQSQPQSPSASILTGADAVLNFTFVANSNPGLTQVILRMGSQQPMGLQFWVADPQNPQNNPPAISADNPNY